MAKYAASWVSQSAEQKSDFLRHVTFDLFTKANPYLICSLSNTISSPTLWAHYADSFYGCALIFSGDLKIFGGGHFVKYQEKLPALDLEDLFENRVYGRDILLTKSRH